MEESEERNAALKKELQSTTTEWSEADAKISILNSQLSKAMKRSDELVTESEQEAKERRKLQDSLDTAVRKAGEATEKLNELAKQKGGIGTGGGDSSFTVEQLNTQVSVLKGRLACPVCHYRDKDCIIMRCRHMFCKHCVEENIQVRYFEVLISLVLGSCAEADVCLVSTWSHFVLCLSSHCTAECRIEAESAPHVD